LPFIGPFGFFLVLFAFSSWCQFIPDATTKHDILLFKF